MPNYTLELELFSLLNASTSDFEIWADGSQLGGGYSITSSGTSISLSVSYGGALPSSLEFRFNDTAPGSPDQIEVRSVKINDRYVNTGNYLSNNILNDGGSSTVNITGSDYIFDSSADPAASEFTTGATRAFTGGDDFYNGYNETTAEVFDMLGGGDYAHLGSGNDKVTGGAGNDVLRGGAGNDLLFGDGDDDRLYGGAGDDTLHGGTGNDRLHGNAGDDEIHGGAGDDRLNGHADNDIITGGAGDDKLTGGSGNDSLFGDGDDDQLMGGSGDDTLDGGDGNDLLYGGSGADQMDGGDGADTLIGGRGDDTINGNDGADTLLGGADNDTLNGGAGDDLFSGGAGNDTMDGGADNDTASYENSSSAITANLLTGIGSGEGSDTFVNIENLTGGNGNDVLTGDAGVNILIGNDGQDDFYGGDGADIFSGGAGEDYFIVEGTEALGDQYDGGANDDYVWLTDDTYFSLATTFTSITAINMNWNDIYAEVNGGYDFTGMAMYNQATLYGNTGAENITGSDYDDNIEGLAGADILNGGLGDDTFYIGGTEGLGDVMDGGAGSDVLRLTSLTYINLATSLTNIDIIQNNFDLYAEVGTGYDLSSITQIWGLGDFYGNTGNETIIAPDANCIIYGLAGNDVISASTSNNAEFYGGTGNDTLNGNTGDDDLYGGDDNDILNASTGFDVLYGGNGNDTLNGGGGGGDIFYGGAGSDTVNGGGNNDVIYGGADADILNGGGGDDNFFVSGNDALGDQYDGGTGNDAVELEADSYFNLATTFTNITAINMNSFDIYAEINTGYDFSGLIMYNQAVLYANTGNETITGSEYSDYMDGLAGNDILNGGDGDDEMYGGLGNDTLNGGDDQDTLYGGGGLDVLNGGLDNDELHSGATATIAADVATILGANAGVVYNADTNSFYQYVNTGTIWGTANTNAQSSTLTGLAAVNGHLVTITSATENTFIESLMDGGSSVWMGATNIGTGTNWFWRDGPELGVQFSTGATSVNGWYENWAAGEPNATNNHARIREGSADWTDRGGDSYHYIIEWEADSLLSGVDTTTLNGGTGNDDLYGSNSGIDIFVLDNTTSVDTIFNFDTTGHDQIDLSSILSGYDPLTDDINDYIQLTTSGSDTDVAVDTAGGASFTNVATIDGVTGLDLQEMIAADNLVL